MCDWFRIDPDGQSADTEHGDDGLKAEEKVMGRTRRVSKSSSGSQPAYAVNCFRKKDQRKGGRLVAKDVAVAEVPSSGAGATYGGAAPAMGATPAETAPAEAGAVKKVFYQHQPQPVNFDAPEVDAPEVDEQVWTLSYITDSIELGVAAQRTLVKVHLDMMARYNVTPADGSDHVALRAAAARGHQRAAGG